jgi:hypothetical protein
MCKNIYLYKKILIYIYILIFSDNLAATLAMRRNYTVPIAPGVFEIDPRFLLFEFCHGLLLRPSQVHIFMYLWIYIYIYMYNVYLNKHICIRISSYI